MKKLLVTLAGIVMSSASYAGPITWVISPDGNANASSITVNSGVIEMNLNGGTGASEGDTQALGQFGAGFVVNADKLTIEWDSDLKTWDSYNALGSQGGNDGYFDSFSVIISKTDFMWNLGVTDPISTSITGVDSAWVWGGTKWGDGVLDTYVCNLGCTDTIMAGVSDGTVDTWYVSFVMDSKSSPEADSLYPSWGTFQVTSVDTPEPGSLALLGAGLVGLGLARRRRQAK